MPAHKHKLCITCGWYLVLRLENKQQHVSQLYAYVHVQCIVAYSCTKYSKREKYSLHYMHIKLIYTPKSVLRTGST